MRARLHLKHAAAGVPPPVEGWHPAARISAQMFQRAGKAQLGSAGRDATALRQAGRPPLREPPGFHQARFSVGSPAFNHTFFPCYFLVVTMPGLG